MFKKISIIVLLSMTTLALTETCRTFTCSSLADKKCWVAADDSKVQLATCQDGAFCKISGFEDTAKEKTCEAKPADSSKQYPGSKCAANEDCFSAKCDKEVCVSVAAGQECKDHDECDIGSACYLKKPDTVKKCQAYKAENDDCENSAECLRSHGCFNKKCTKYFSLPDGTDAVDEAETGLSFCSSGKAYNGKCHTLTRSNTKCTTDGKCKYKVDNKDEVEINENCSCGFNKDSDKYCKQGTDLELVKKINDYLTLDKCHTLERNGMCNYYKRYQVADKKEIVGKYTNSFIKSNNILENADSCVLKVVFPDYDSSLDPVVINPKCAKYTCDKTPDNSCAFGHFTAADNFNTVKLNDVCKKEQKCVTAPSALPFKDLTEVIDKDVKGTCTDVKITLPAYPGEACVEDKDCYNGEPNAKTGKCESKVCTGSKADEDCTHDSQCLVGNYCDGSKCKAQKKADEECKNHFQCLNGLACVSGKCGDKYFSLENGADADNENLCKSRRRTAGGKCTSWTSTDTKDAKLDNMVKCDNGSMCNYVDHEKTSVKIPCQCGYNADGFGYCPRDDVEGNFFII
jgi:hypothetical protein